MGKIDTLLDVALEALDSLLQEFLLPFGNALQGVNGLLGTIGLEDVSQLVSFFPRDMRATYAELDGDREEVDANLLGDGVTSGDAREVDVARLNKTLLALDGPKNLLGEAITKSVSIFKANVRIVTGHIPESSIGHGKSGGTSTALGLNDFITAKLDAVDQGIVLVVRDVHRGRSLAEERNDGLAGVSTNDRDGEALGLGLASNASDEGLSTDDIKGGDSEQTLWVEDVLGLENLGGDRDSRVDWVGDD